MNGRLDRTCGGIKMPALFFRLKEGWEQHFQDAGQKHPFQLLEKGVLDFLLGVQLGCGWNLIVVADSDGQVRKEVHRQESCHGCDGTCRPAGCSVCTGTRGSRRAPVKMTSVVGQRGQVPGHFVQDQFPRLLIWNSHR